MRKNLAERKRVQGDLEIETLERVEEDPEIFFKKVKEITDEDADIFLYLLREEVWGSLHVCLHGTR
ncbi:MAG: hypothetical protein ACUVTL_08175 [Thermoproteota archaeon]